MIRIEGSRVIVEGGTARPLSTVLAAAEKRPAIMRTQYVPPGVRAVYRQGNSAVLVHETLPGVRTMRWIREDSPQSHGEGATYRTVRISVPFTQTFVLLARAGNGLWVATHGNEAFFSIEPFGPGVPLFYPALLNVSKFPADAQAMRSLAWICTANYKFRGIPAKDAKEPGAESKSAALVVKQVVENLLLAGFNYSSENHEGQSWYSETAAVEKRISTIAKWETLSAKDPMAGMGLKYIPVGLSVESIAERMFRLNSAPSHAISEEAGLTVAVANAANAQPEPIPIPIPIPEPEGEEEE